MTTNLGLNGQAISEITSDFTVSLRTDAGYEVRIEGTFALRNSQGAMEEHVPGDPGVDKQVGTLKGERVVSATVDDSGVLHISFESGRAVQVMPDEAYEAWTVAGPRGMKVVCMPGGELASWSPQSSRNEPGR